MTGSGTLANQTLSKPIQTEPFELRGFEMVLLPTASVLTLTLGTRPGKQEGLGITLDAIKQAAIRVARRPLDSVTIQEIFDECTAAHDDLHRNRGFSPWQLLLGKTSQFVKVLILFRAVLKLWTSDEMSTQASESAPLDVLVASFEREILSQTMSTRRLTFKRPSSPLDRALTSETYQG